MQCGPIRFRDDAKKQAEKRPFNHFVIPRFTSYRITLEMEKKDTSIQDLYSEISVNNARNQLIIDDVINCFNSCRNCIVLTERKAHIESLRKELLKHIPDLIVLTGGMGIKETRNALEKVKNIPGEKPLILLSTGKFIGEGFDEPRLDTLFLAMPISWKGTLQQYAGRLHRLFETKKEVIIYDYVDAHVSMFEKMYTKRLNGYSSIGYKIKPESFQNSSADIIFNRDSFLQVFSNDILNSQENILIVSPFMTKNRTNQILKEFEPALRNGIKITIVTRPTAEYKDSDKHKNEDVLKNIKEKGIEITFKPKIHQKYAIIDSRIVWYGSINLLSYGSAEESIMRIESTSIAFELSKLIVFD